MQSAPTILFETKDLYDTESFIKKKEYEIKLNNSLFNLLIKIDSNYIYFRIIEIKENEVPLSYYSNKMHLKSIRTILKLPSKDYNNLSKIMDLYNDAYYNNDINISFEENMIILRILNPFIDIDYPIHLHKIKTNIDEKMEIIINNIIFIKKNRNSLLTNEKLDIIENLLKDIKNSTRKKLKQNEELIKQLNYNIIESNFQIKKNDEEIKELKLNILKIKDGIMRYKNLIFGINFNLKQKYIQNNNDIIHKNKDESYNKKKLPDPIKKVSNLFSNKIDIRLKNKIEEEKKNISQINLFQKTIDSASENDDIQKIFVKKMEEEKGIKIIKKLD